MVLPLGSSQALADPHAFMRFHVFQWIIGATDGHAKNFSIFLAAGGSYRLTSFYDILSAYPLIAAKRLYFKSLKLAMSLKTTKYQLEKMYALHFIATPKEVGFKPDQMSEIMNELAVTLPAAIEQVKP